MKLPDIVKIAVHVRLAKKTDLLIGPGLLKFNQPFYLYSHKTKRFEGLYVINNQTNSQELKAWFHANMVYVPINVLENNISILNHNNHGHNIHQAIGQPEQVQG